MIGIAELKTKNNIELQSLLIHKREELRSLKFDLSQKKVKNVRSLHEVKKDIARILTVLNSKPE